MNTYHILVNPAAASGRGRKVWKKIRPELDRLGVTYKQFFPASVDHVREIIHNLESTSPDPIHLIVIGGDGTMSTVLNAITDLSRFQIGYIPAGSANDLALSLGLSPDPVENLSSILEGTVRRHLDVGMVETGGKRDGYVMSPVPQGDIRTCPSLSPPNAPVKFLVSAGIGFDAAVCAGVNGSALKKVLSKLGLSKLSYLLIALKILFTEKKAACTVTMDDGVRSHHMDRAMFAAVMIERYEGGGFMFAPNADASDGLFDLCMIGDISVPRFLISLPKAKRGTHFSIKGADHALAGKVTIHTDLPLYVHADGDVIARATDITFTCLQQVLQLLN